MTRPRGTERPQSGPVLKLDLPEALRRLKAEEAWRTRPRNAVTLLKEGGLRVVLVGLHEGAAIEPHRAEGPTSIHLLSGAVRVTAGEEEFDLAPGQVLAMDAGVRHALQAGEESAFLLTIAMGPPPA